MSRLAAAIALVMLTAAPALSQSAPPPDLRIVWGDHVLARRGASPTPRGTPVRIVGANGACDGTLAAEGDVRVENEEGEAETAQGAGVVGCRPTVSSPLFAIVHPRPRSSWPVSREATDPRATDAIALAQQAAATAGHLRGAQTWETPRVYELGDALYVLVSGPACSDEEAETGCSPRVAAVTRVRAGGAPEVVIARPAHWLWTHEELIDCSFGWAGIVDVDGDGTIELVEGQIGESAFMIRLVRASDRPAGDVAWLASYRDDPTDATVGRLSRVH